MMCIMSNEGNALCVQVEGTQGQIFAASPMALQSRCKRVPNETIPMYCHSWPQSQSFHLQCKTDRVRRYGETAIGGQYATRRVVLMPGTEYSTRRVSLTAPTSASTLTQPFCLDGNVFCWWVPDALGNYDWAMLQMHLEAMMLQPWSPWLRKFVNALENRNLASLEAVIESV